MKPTALPRLLSAALLATICCLLPGQAEARFGRSGSGGSAAGRASASSAGVNHTHTASAPSTGAYTSSGYVGGGYPTSYRSFAYGYGYSPYYSCWGDPSCPRYAWGFGYRPFWGWGTGYALQPVYAPTPGTVLLEQEQRPLITTVELEGQAWRGNGAGVGATLAFEKDRWGLEGRYTGLFTPSQAPAGGTDAIHLLDVHATYALLSGPRGRLRVGAGLDSAFAPDVIFAGPALVASAGLGLIGPVGLEGSLDVVPFPFTKVDWNAGLAAGFGALGVRAGWRRIYLNDNGYADGTSHVDVFNGPYVAVALAL